MDTYSFVFDRQDARVVFKQVCSARLLQTTIGAGRAIPEVDQTAAPVRSRNNTRQHRQQHLTVPDSLVCVGIHGPAAEEVQQELVMAFERLAISILQCFEGGPAMGQDVARADGQRWCAASHRV